MTRRRPAPPRAERVFAPPINLLLTEDDLRAWLAAIVPALIAVGCSHPTKYAPPDPDCAIVREVEPPDHTVSDICNGATVPLYTIARPRQFELSLRVAAPDWVAARALEIRLTGDGGCSVTQGRSGYKSARDVGDWLRDRRPRWAVPPQGRLPFAIGLREWNGWEGEGWTYWLPLGAEADVLALATGAPVASGRGMRCTPFDPPSLTAFGSWRLGIRYVPEWRARYLSETSRCGYMPYQNWSGNEAADLAALIAEARELEILRWRSGDGPGLSMWKGRIELHGAGGTTPRRCALA